MTDNSWRNLEPWERVKWAREQRFDTAAAAAVALGMKEGTYRCYERGPDSAKFMRLDYRHAQAFAREFRVRWQWLLEGVGEPWLTRPREAAETPKPPNNLRAWREFSGFTVAELARKSGLGVQTINELEGGRAELSFKYLHPIADALGTTVGRIIDHDPNDLDPRFLDAATAIPKERRGQALEILKTFRAYTKLR